MNSIKQERPSLLAALALLACFWLVFMFPDCSIGQQTKVTPSEVAMAFQRATEAFGKKDFESAKSEFTAVALASPGSELGIQAEYFSALAKWNLAPSDIHAAEIQHWLEKAFAFEAKMKSQGKSIVSPSWDRWVEAAHLILAKREMQKWLSVEAERRLRQLAHFHPGGDSTSSTPSPPIPTGYLTPPSVVWPRQSPCSPQVWLELGGLLRHENPSSEEALQCFEKAIEACDRQSGPSNELLHTIAAWHAIECIVSQGRWEDVAERLEVFAERDLSEEFRIRSKLLEVSTKKRLAQAVDIAREIEPLVDLALSGNTSAQLLYELGIALAEAGSRDQSEVVLIELINRYPKTGISIEARLRLARQYASTEQWKQASKLAEEAIELGCPDPWIAFAWYIQGKGHNNSNASTEAIRCFERGLAEGKPSVELEITLRVELLEVLYQSEQWAKIGPHAEWLLSFAAKETPPPTWLPLVLLRQAETLANRSDWSEAAAMVSRLCRDFPEWKKADEADYLLARCCIARADFQGARERLDRIVLASSTSNPTLSARAGWMAGETFMMQRRYADAAASYQRVLSIPGEEYWHAASALQLGVCAEMGRDSEVAAQWYRRVLDRYPETPFAKTASERLNSLQSATKQAERIGSGKKR